MKSLTPISAAALAFTVVASPLQAADRPSKKGAAPAAAKAPAPAPAAAASPGNGPEINLEPPAPALPEVVAVVEGTEIKGAELEQAVNSYLASRQIPADALPAAERARGNRFILEEMIKDALLKKRSADVKVSDEDVKATFQKFASSVGSEAEVQQQIAASGQTMEGIYDSIRASLRQDRWLEAAVEKSGAVTDKDAEDYYKKNADKFVSPPEVRASHILLKLPPDAKPEQVAEKEKAAQAIAARVKKGEDFAKLATELSEDPSAKKNSGDLNFFSKEQMVPEFSAAAFSMKKGEVSGPVRSDFGIHIIKVTDRKESEHVPLEQVKPKLLAFLRGQKAEALKQDLRDKAQVKINLPEPPPAATAPEPSSGAAAPVPAAK